MEIDIFDYIKARPRDNLELLEIQKNKNIGKRYHNFVMHCLIFRDWRLLKDHNSPRNVNRSHDWSKLNNNKNNNSQTE